MNFCTEFSKAQVFCVSIVKSQPHKLVKHTQTIPRLLPRNCLGVFNNFMELVLKGLRSIDQLLQKQMVVKPYLLQQ